MRVGVAIVSTATIDDQVRLGRLKIKPMKNLHIARTLWRLKVPGRIDIPAALAFERVLTQIDKDEQAGRTEPRGASSRLYRATPSPACVAFAPIPRDNRDCLEVPPRTDTTRIVAKPEAQRHPACRSRPATPGSFPAVS